MPVTIRMPIVSAGRQSFGSISIAKSQHRNSNTLNDASMGDFNKKKDQTEVFKKLHFLLLHKVLK